ncbi:exodeoxyribonuclease VII small subunit [Schleiferilactobacillus shenzhenensis]|uniref:Exodeoxyribonuclease 7 small subunit n=1 Tax=Schleiferilactobacillus shenzhenensis LY-73 TaxID=1231336 RepID=U4TUL3_9LACO|nr:exodeoxyribonuclease VII small subunit [Schleiferilactobacillus shenzhenensis]ERL65563.1 XseB [Schleiferilactobacillus shenzhenensis LY-73]
MATKTSKKQPSFEENMTALQNIVNRLESGDVPLEEALTQFEQGIKLTRTLEKTLTQAEQAMNKIVAADGQEKPLDQEGTDAHDSSPADDSDQ